MGFKMLLSLTGVYQRCRLHEGPTHDFLIRGGERAADSWGPKVQCGKRGAEGQLRKVRYDLGEERETEK